MKVVWKIIKTIVTILLLIVLALVILQKVTKNKITIGNIYIFQIASASMLPEYNVGDVIVVRKVAPSEIKKGDDVTYIGSIDAFTDLTITHRIVDIRVEEGRYYFTTQGLSNNISDPEINEDSVFGKVIYHTILFSFVGRLMTNVIIYYILFIAVGISFSYEVISSFLIKKPEDDDEEEANIENEDNPEESTEEVTMDNEVVMSPLDNPTMENIEKEEDDENEEK